MDANKGEARTLERCLACEADGRNHSSVARLVADRNQERARPCLLTIHALEHIEYKPFDLGVDPQSQITT